MTALARNPSYEDLGLLTRERIGYVLTSAAQRWPDRELLLFQGKRLTYRDIWRWSTRIAHHMIENGIRPGDRVVLQLPNAVETILAQFALWRIGAVSVPVIPVYRQHEMRHIIGAIHPTAVLGSKSVGSRNLCKEIDEILAEIGETPRIKYAIEREDAEPGWTSLPPQPKDSDPISEEGLPEPTPHDECVLILFTSGTTSVPKGVYLSGRSITANTATWIRTLGITDKWVALAGSPIAHIAALSISVIIPLCVGSRTVMLPAWDGEEAVRLIEEEGIAFMAAAAFFLNDLVQRYENGAGQKHRIPLFLSGGAATPPALIERAEKVGVKAGRIYGMTETAGIVAIAHPDDPLERRANTDGKVVFGTEVQIVDDMHNPLPYGEMGEIRLRSPQLMIGYTDKAVTEERVDKDGWFYPGDVGRIDADGWLTMTGRSKDIINRGGEKFSAQDIEEAVASHPDIMQCAVCAVPDSKFGEAVAAFVTLRPGTVWNGAEPILRYLDEIRLAKQKFPVYWRVMDTIPMTSIGKVQKQKLLDLPPDWH